MKKIVRKAFVALAFLGLGTGVTSCDTEAITQYLPTILQIVQQFLGGSAQTFVGSESVTRLTREDVSGNTWINDENPVAISNSQSLSFTANDSESTANITFPDITFHGITISGITISGADYTKKDGDNSTVITFNENAFYYTCTRTENGETTQIEVTESNQDSYYLYLSSGQVITTENQTSIKLSISLIMGKEAFNMEYTGTLQQQ